MKNIVLIIGGLLIVAAAGFFIFLSGGSTTVNNDKEPVVPSTEQPVVEEMPNEEIMEVENEPISVIGKSVAGNDIMAYHFGKGEKEVLFVGGTHGGYSWNTALLNFELIDWFSSNESIIPDNVKVTVIPVLNPDGLETVTGSTGRFNPSDASKVESEKIAGRFNANEVDLNRNFDCEWKAAGTWQNRTVSGGSKPFSEPESSALRTYVLENKPVAAVTWYSAAGGVYASNCKKGILPGTKSMTELFAKASGYSAYEEFDYYEITGDMVNWFASQNIPAISVLLTNHENTELSKNKAGVEAILKYLAE